MSEFPPKGPLLENVGKGGQGVTYIDNNDESAGYQGAFNLVYSNQYIEKVSLCPGPTSGSSERIASSAISFSPGCDTIYLNVPETRNTLSELTLITRSKAYPSSVVLNGVTRAVNWVGRSYELNLPADLIVEEDGCSGQPSTLDLCWNIICFRVYHGPVESDVIVFAYIEGQTLLTETLPV